MKVEKQNIIEINRKLLEQIPNMLEKIRRQSYVFALRMGKDIIGDLEEFLGKLVLEKQMEFQAILEPILQAQENQDYILMADYYECLLLPFLNNLQEELLLSEKEEKDDDNRIQYSRGREKLQQKNPELARKLPKYLEKKSWLQKGYKLERTSSGSYTLSVTVEGRSYYLHSNVNPGWEAKKLASHWYEVEKRKYVIYGLGLGYQISALAAQDSSIQIQIYEGDLTTIEIALAYGCLTKLLEEERICLVYDPNGKKLMEELAKEPAALIPFYPSLHTVQEKTYQEWLEARFFQYQSVKNQKIWLQQNFRENIRLHCDSIQKLKEKEGGKRFFIISAGPSLDRNFLELRKKKAGDVILATVPVLGKLLRAGIKPDYAVISDPLEKQKHFLENLKNIDNAENIKVPLLFLSTASKNYVQNYPGEKYILCQKGFEEAEKIAERKGWPLLEAGGSVAIIAFSVAIQLGAKEVVFVGQDLAYSQNKRHAEETSGTELNADAGFCYQRKDIYGNLVRVPRNLELFRIRLEELVKKNPQVRFWNATEGGVAIKGVPNINLKELLEHSLSKRFVFDIDGVITEPNGGMDYQAARPNKKMIQVINRLYQQGHEIILFTARGYVTGIDWRAVTEQQLADWNVSYHELHFGKPNADYYVDDRMLDMKLLLEMGEEEDEDSSCSEL